MILSGDGVLKGFLVKLLYIGMDWIENERIERGKKRKVGEEVILKK